MSKLSSCFFEVVIDKHDKLNDKDINSINLEEVLKSLPSLIEYSFILHDKDKTRPHYHINILLGSSHQADSLLYSLAGDLMINVNCITIRSVNSSAYYERQRYLTHMFETDKSKYKYDNQEVFTNNIDNYNLCISGVNPYLLSIESIYAICKSSQSLFEVYNKIGLSKSNTYYKLIKDIWVSILNEN